jgi:DNA-binding GntR family transcriptional regulator
LPAQPISTKPKADRSGKDPGGNEPIPRFHPDSTLVRRSSAEQAAAYIRELIFNGYLPPGSRIPQDDIARALGISRIPIREAIVALEQEGRIRTEIHRGAFVVPLDERSIRDASELVSLMQGFVIRRAAERATPELKSRLEEVQRQINGTTDPVEMGKHMEEQRALILSAGTAPRIAQWIRGTNDLVMDNFYEVVPGSLDNFKTHSAKITRAILENDADTAERVGRDNSAVEDVIQYYRERGLFGEPDI